MYNDRKARFFLLVDLRDFFLDLGSGGRKKINKKALKMTSSLVIFRAFYLFFFFLISPEKNSKTSEVNFNFYIFHHFPKNLDRKITLNSVTLKNAQTEPQNKIFFFSTKQIIFRVGE